jgi:DNA-binding NtrC family response regulator
MISDKRVCPVLIVEDDGDLCRILVAMLTKMCPVHVEHDLHSAESYLTKRIPVIILMDNNLPDGLGVDKIKSILDLHPQIKIVLMTADLSEGLKEKAIHDGAVRFITKPFRATAIRDLLLAVCPDLRAA